MAQSTLALCDGDVLCASHFENGDALGVASAQLVNSDLGQRMGGLVRRLDAHTFGFAGAGIGCLNELNISLSDFKSALANIMQPVLCRASLRAWRAVCFPQCRVRSQPAMNLLPALIGRLNRCSSIDRKVRRVRRALVCAKSGGAALIVAASALRRSWRARRRRPRRRRPTPSTTW